MPDLTPERREVLIAEAWASLGEGRTHHGLVITVGVLGGVEFHIENVDFGFYRLTFNLYGACYGTMERVVEMAVDRLYAEGLIK